MRHSCKSAYGSSKSCGGGAVPPCRVCLFKGILNDYIIY
jgi:hypothetical protein